MKLTLPLPPSANRYWRNFRGRMVVSPEARQYKSDVAKLILDLKAVPELPDPDAFISVTVDVYRARKSGDLDNRLKCLLDALKGIAFVDDRQVVRIHAERHDDPKNPRVEVLVEEVP